MSASSGIVADLVNKKVRADLSNGDAIEGTLGRADNLGALFLLDRMIEATPTGIAEAEAGEDSISAFVFVPWSQVQMVIPFPGEMG